MAGKQFGREQTVSLDQALAAVKATILSEAQGRTIDEIELENENGQLVCEDDDST